MPWKRSRGSCRRWNEKGDLTRCATVAGMELIDYAESQGKECYAWHARVNDITRNEANVTLAFLVAGGGASFGWGIAGAGQAHGAALLVLSVWLFALAGLVQLRCLHFTKAMPPANHPLQVYLPDFDTDGIREIQLQHLEQAIVLAIEKGNLRAKRLGRLRLATCFSPVVYLAAWAVCHAVPQ